MRRHQVRLFPAQLMATAYAETLWWELPAVSWDLWEGQDSWGGGMVGTKKHGVRWAGTKLVGRHPCICKLWSDMIWFWVSVENSDYDVENGRGREPRAEARRPVRRLLPGSERERWEVGLGPGWRWRCEAGGGSCGLVVESPPGRQIRFQDLVNGKEQLILRFLT